MDEYTKIRYNIILGKHLLIALGIDAKFPNMSSQEVTDHTKDVQQIWLIRVIMILDR